MLTTRKNISISHPHIRDAYIKDGARMGVNGYEKVLVLETYPEEEDLESAGLDPYIFDLLTDLETLKHQAVKKCGKIDRIDICRH